MRPCCCAIPLATVVHDAPVNALLLVLRALTLLHRVILSEHPGALQPTGRRRHIFAALPGACPSVEFVVRERHLDAAVLDAEERELPRDRTCLALIISCRSTAVTVICESGSR
jgi:hypothetical protein